jgi:hypothetical protein
MRSASSCARALIPPGACKIEDLSKAISVQLAQLQAAIKVALTMQRLNAQLTRANHN